VNTYRKHLISLIKNEHLHRICLQESSLNHVLDASRSANDDLRAVLERLHIITDASSANTRVALNAHEVANGNDDLLDLLRKLTGRSKNQSLALLNIGIDLLKNRDRESGGLPGS
jgi:hypothetical protein